MKIVFLARYLPAEGSTTHMYTLADALIQQGHEVHLVSGGPNDKSMEIYDQSVESGLIHHRVPFPGTVAFSRVGLLKQLAQYAVAFPSALKVIWSIQPDVMHVHYPVTSYVAAAYRRLTGCPFVVTHHISGIPDHPLNRVGDRVIAISSELAAEIKAGGRYSAEQVVQIPNGVDDAVFTPPSESEKSQARVKLGLSPDDTVIAFVGTISLRKGLDVLVEALTEIPRAGVKVLVQGDGDLAWFNQLVADALLSDVVIRHPFGDPGAVYAVADVFVLPSRAEGFPLVVVEAMMSGLPVVRSNVEGAADQIRDGETGMLFASEDAQALADRFTLLIGDPGLRGKIGRAAAEYAKTEFGQAKMADRTLMAYKSAINGPTEQRSAREN